MKEFENWDCEYCGDADTKCPASGGCSECEEKRKEGWRAAFKCILGKCHHYQNQDVIDFILKELEKE